MCVNSFIWQERGKCVRTLNSLFPIQPYHKRFKGILLESQSYLDLQSELRSAEICADLQLRQGVLGLVAVP